MCVHVRAVVDVLLVVLVVLVVLDLVLVVAEIVVAEIVVAVVDGARAPSRRVWGWWCCWW